MKTFGLSAFALAASLLSLHLGVTASPLEKRDGMSYADGQLFNIDGKTQYWAGTNAWWLAHLSNDADIELSVKQMAKSGLKVIRVWGFGDVTELPAPGSTDPNKVYFQYLNSTSGKGQINYGADGLQRLDYVVSRCQRYGLKLILPFTNNWGDYGGIDAYARAFGTTHEEWYNHAPSQAVYKAYIKALVTRYKHSRAIFAWELGNEPRCRGCSTDVIYNWATEISAYIKSLDKQHMVTLGDEGWLVPTDKVANNDGSYAYSGYEGVDWVRNLGIKDLDFGTFHLYPASWSYNNTWGSEWIWQHDVLAKNINKPIVLEEYGTQSSTNHLEVQLPWENTVLKNTTIAMDQFWQFGPQGTTVDTKSLSDPNTIYYNTPEYQTLVIDHAKQMMDKKH